MATAHTEKGKTMSDLIEREDAKKALRHVFSTCDPCCREEAVDIAVTTVEAIPSARPKGEWIKEHGVVNCSNCNHSHWSDCYEDTVVRFNFCPNCGADMREREGE